MKPVTKIKLTKRQKEWAWFIGLWTSSLLLVMSLGYAIKFLMALI